jgi:hypothetical protein
MTRQNLESIAESLVADGKGILAADETVPTLNQTIRHTRNWVDRAEPSHLPRNAFYLASGGIYQRGDHVCPRTPHGSDPRGAVLSRWKSSRYIWGTWRDTID